MILFAFLDFSSSQFNLVQFNEHYRLPAGSQPQYQVLRSQRLIRHFLTLVKFIA